MYITNCLGSDQSPRGAEKTWGVREQTMLFKKSDAEQHGGYMKTAVVFGPLNSLDFTDIRLNVLRIPEVGIKIAEAQEAWDELCGTNFSFQHFLCSEDHSFFNNINLKSLALAIVQLGLYDRYVRHFGEPQFLVGNTQNDAALLVAARVMPLKKLISLSPACTLQRPMAPLQIASDTLLMGQSLPKFQAISLDNVAEQNGAIGEADMSLEKILVNVVEKHSVSKIVHVGPGLMNKSKCFNKFEMSDVQIVESIDVDPMLQWFWSDLRKYDTQTTQAQ